MKGKAKAGYVLARISEVIFWLAAAIQAAAFAVTAVIPEKMSSLYDVSASADWGVMVKSVSGGVGIMASRAFNVGWYLLQTAAGAVEMVLVALVFRRVWQIIRLSWDSTPFQKPVVAKIRQIGWLVIAEPLVTLAVNLVSGLIWRGYSYVVDVTGIITGVIVLALSQIFAYGVKLEDDVEGLL